MTLKDLNNSLEQLASNQDRDSIINFAFALMNWIGVEPNSGSIPQLLAPKTQKLKDYLENAPKTIQPQLYRLSNDNQPIRVRFAVLKKVKKEYISQLVDNDPGAESYQNTPAPLRVITKAPYFVHFVTTPAYDKLVLIFNQGDQKRVVSFRSRLTNTQYNKIIQQWQGIARKNKTEIADIFWKSLDIKEVNKEFYKQIKERFDALLGIVKTQSSKATENQVKQFTVRLIGRYIFCWFLKEKGIISQALIGKESISATKDFYQTILIKLFFETLNTKVQDRNSLAHEKLFEKIPYLNGGLFDETDEDRIFSDLRLDDWIKPFVEILESYDFTVDESSSQYQQVAVDPEMLGRIFENLLASQNEETEKLANQRKAFGAFYTPREIVDYMVNESIKAYLSSELKVKDEDLTSVFSANPVWPEKLKTKKSDALKAIENIKILDPACGSGAFPMGILHKLVELHELLGTVKSSYELKKDILSQNIFGVDIMPMAIEIARLRAWLSLVLEEDYKPNDPKHNFGVKPLPNLDFKFVCANSLVDSGFDTLYNKYIADVNIPRAASMVSLAREIPELIKIRNQYFDAASKNKKKEEIMGEYESKKEQIKSNFSTLRRNYKEVDSFLENIDQWNPFDENKISPFFSPTWMFGVDAGFDIVIGNPPYGINIKKSENPLLASQYKDVLKGEVESYILFYYRGLKMLSKSGHLTFITPDSWFTNKGAGPFRKYLSSNHSLKDVFDIYKPFDAAKDTRVHTVLISVTKDVPEVSVKQVHPQNTELVYRDYTVPASTIAAFLDNEWRFYIDKSERKIFDKIESISEPLENLFSVKYGLRTGDNSRYVTTEKTKYPVIAGADIASLFHVKWKPKYLQRTEELSQGYFEEYYTDKKVIVQRIRTNSLDLNARWIEAAYIEGNYIPNDSLTYLYEKTSDYSIMYLLAVINSFLMNRYYRAYYTDVNVKPTYLSQLPIPRITLAQQAPFIKIVGKIISLKQKSQESISLEKELNTMVYKLFTLSYEEILVIDPNFWLTEKQFKDFKISNYGE